MVKWNWRDIHRNRKTNREMIVIKYFCIQWLTKYRKNNIIDKLWQLKTRNWHYFLDVLKTRVAIMAQFKSAFWNIICSVKLKGEICQIPFNFVIWNNYCQNFFFQGRYFGAYWYLLILTYSHIWSPVYLLKKLSSMTEMNNFHAASYYNFYPPTHSAHQALSPHMYCSPTHYTLYLDAPLLRCSVLLSPPIVCLSPTHINFLSVAYHPHIHYLSVLLTQNKCSACQFHSLM